MIKTLWLAIVVGLVCWPHLSQGDGKVFPQTGFALAETPAQRSLVHWADGTETLVVETTVRSDATNLAWVLPLPSQPTSIRGVDAGLFPTLQTTFQARVVLTQSKWWIGGVVLAVVVLIARWQAQRKLPLRTLDYLFVTLILLLFGSMLLPSLATAKAKGGGMGASDSTVQLLAQTRAGVFDITTLTAARAEDLVQWLRDHGFSAPDEILPVARDYVSRGWVFAAANVSNPVPGDLAALHPVAFTFAAAEPVYPIRLTGVGSTSLRCDLYVFGPDRAAASGWREVYCAKPKYETNLVPQMAPLGLRVRHAELAAIVRKAPIATKLSANLEARDFRSDVVISWRSFRSRGNVTYTRSTALATAANVGAWSLVVALLAGCVRFQRPADFSRWFTMSDRLGLVVSIVIGIGTFAALPKAHLKDVRRINRWPLNEAKQQLRHFALSEAIDLPTVQATVGNGPFPSELLLADARHEFASFLRTNRYAGEYARLNWCTSNWFSTERLRMEASPGNIAIEVSSNGLDLVWHDFDGFPALREAIPKFEGDPNQKSSQVPRD